MEFQHTEGSVRCQVALGKSCQSLWNLHPSSAQEQIWVTHPPFFKRRSIESLPTTDDPPASVCRALILHLALSHLASKTLDSMLAPLSAKSISEATSKQ